MATRQRAQTVGDTVSAEGTETVSDAIADVTKLPVSVTTSTIGNVVEVVASRSFKVNMGNYESADSFVSVKMTVTPDTDFEALSGELAHVIDTLQGDDLVLFKSLTTERKSIAHKLV
jgi:acetolactate synthase regulatory subunit